MKAAVFLIAILCATSCSPDKATRIKAEDDIREATFRHQLLQSASGQQPRAKVYFLSIGELGADPTDQFMQRFAGHKPVIKKVSQCTSDHMGVRDKATGEDGLIFSVTKIKWISATIVEVEGGYFEAGLSASGNTYYLKKDNGEWVVVRHERNWIS